MITIESLSRETDIKDIKLINNCLNINYGIYGYTEHLTLTYRKVQDTPWSYKVLRIDGLILGFYRLLGLSDDYYRRLYNNTGVDLSELVDKFEGADITEHSDNKMLTTLCIVPEMRFIGIGGLLINDLMTKSQGCRMLVPTFNKQQEELVVSNKFNELFDVGTHKMWHKHV